MDERSIIPGVVALQWASAASRAETARAAPLREPDAGLRRQKMQTGARGTGASPMSEGRDVADMRRGRAAVLLTAGVAAAALAGCGAAGTGPASTAPQPGPQLRQALRAWSAFPVSASPRPLVLLGSPVADPPGGFPDGAAKLAYLEGAVTVPSVLPSGAATAGGYPLISASQAFGVFKSAAGKGPRAAVRLTVSAVRLGTGVFDTDRGLRRLPAWLFGLRDVRGPAAVLAVAPAAIFSAPGTAARKVPLVNEARLGGNGRTLTVWFVGAPSGTGPCTAAYHLALAESRTAVAVAVHEHEGQPGPASCAAVGFLRHVSTVLSAPLGARVVVDAASGTAVAVSQARAGPLS